MARLLAILGALARAVRRDVGTFGSLGLNNFFFFIFSMMYGAAESHMEPKSAYPFLLLLLIVLLFPLSSDPLDKVPPSRRALWPLTRSERIGLRVASLLLSPVLWLALLLFLFKRIDAPVAIAFLTALIGVQAIASLARTLASRGPRLREKGDRLLCPQAQDADASQSRRRGQSGLSPFSRRLLLRWTPLKWLPSLPGKLGGLMRNHLRQIFQVLDLYVALILTLSTVAYRLLAAKPDPDAFPILSVMVACAMSTYAQVLFGLDRASGAMSRYRLFPLRGWQILVAKDASYLGVVLLLVLPLDPLPGLSFALFALAVGHHASVLEKIPLRHWRFCAGRPAIGVIQTIGGFIFGLSAHRTSPIFALISLAIYLVSLALYGWLWDRRARPDGGL